MKTKTVNIACWLLAARVQKYWKRALKKDPQVCCGGDDRFLCRSVGQ